jgi:cellobiose epimerase
MKKETLLHLRAELETELAENILDWWMKYSPDMKLGGFHGHIDHKNQVVEGAGKGAVLNARILWTFSAAYRMFNLPDYLDMARRANDYVIRYFTDKKLGGVYWELAPNGSVRSARKQVYATAFAIYGLAEYYMASGDDYPLKKAKGLFRDLEAYALDREYNGYIDALSRDWKVLEDQRLSEKDQNEKKTMNTHLHILEAYSNLYRIWKDPDLEKALENLIRLFLEKFVDQKRKQLNLFFDERWTLKSTLISYGHDIECSWLLHEAAEILGDKELIEKTSKLAVDMARANEAGLAENGGLHYEYLPDRDDLDSDKHWWPQAEAMVGYFNAYQLSKDSHFLERSLESWDFIKDQIIDHQLGEWYWSVDSKGKPRTDKEKAGFWKCPYHNGRACLEMIRRINHIEKTR